MESGWNQGGWFDLYMYTKTWNQTGFLKFGLGSLFRVRVRASTRASTSFGF